MNRRSFLKLLGLAPAASVLPALTQFAARAAALDITTVAGAVEAGAIGVILPSSGFAKALWPGVNKYWTDYYEQIAVQMESQSGATKTSY